MYSTTIVYSPLAYVQLFNFLWFKSILFSVVINRMQKAQINPQYSI